MNYKKHNAGSQSLLIQTVVIILICILNTNHVQAQINDSISFSSLYRSDTIYVFTNRNIDTTCEDLSFSNGVNDSLGLAILKVTLNKSGEIENQLISYDDFIAQSSKKPSDWLLFVHGDSKTYNQSVQRGFDIQNSYNINVIVFSWSSKDPDLSGLKNLNKSRSNLLKSMDHFNELLGYMESFKKLNPAFHENTKLSMLLHSLGNFFLENSVKNPTHARKTDPIFTNVIINSAAVNQTMHQEWVNNINIQERIYITNNKFDFNLKGLHIFSKSGNQLGEKAKGPTAANANYINFSKAVGFGFPTGSTHTYFIGKVSDKSKNIRKFYFDSFHGRSINLSDETQFIKKNKEIRYHIIF